MTIATESKVRPTLGDFTVESLGVHHPDYFGGYGIACSREYTNCACGIGDTEFEALEDCMEQMAQSCPIDFDDSVEQRIREEFGATDNCITALDEVGCTALDEYPDHKCPECGNDISDVTFGDNCAECGKEFDYPEHVPYWHVGIKWNIREEQRIQRIRNLPNIQPTRYESYETLNRDSHGYAKDWGYVRRADGSASYGDFHDDDWPESAEAYFNTLCADIEETAELYFYVPYASGSDYSGSTVEAANAKCIEDTYGDEEWVHPVYGGFSTFAVAIGLTGLLTCDEDTFDEFCEAIEGLEDYPVIDEEVLCELEAEKTGEAWKSWCRDDFVRALEKEHDDEIDFDWPDDPDDLELWSFFHDHAEKANVYWYCEGSGPDMYIDLDAVVKETDFDDYSQWAVRYKVTWCDLGDNSEDYYSENDAAERVATLRTSGHTGASYVILEPEAISKTSKTDTSD